jgi:hypothetical protein
MERHAWEVTKMAGRIKANPSLLPAKQGVTGRSVVREIIVALFSLSDRLQYHALLFCPLFVYALGGELKSFFPTENYFWES